MGGFAFGKLQSREEIYRLVFTAVCRRRAIAAVYDGTVRRLCPHVLGYDGLGEHRVFCYQYGGESRSGPQARSGAGIWRCLSLDKLAHVELLDGDWQTEPHGPQHCVRHVEIAAEDQPDREPQNGQ